MHKTLKALLLAAPATIVLAGAGQAADLPAYKAAPIEYVRICDAYGAGFFTIPGTDTCLRVGGYVRYQFEYTPGQRIVSINNGAVTQVAGSQDTTGMEVRGRIYTDARTPTPYGTLQTYVRLRSTNADGLRAVSAGVSQFATSYNAAGNKSSTITMERAYIRFAGFTFGLQDENFNTAAGPSYFFGTGPMTSGFSNGVKALTYTAVLPQGITWQNSIESRGDYDFDGYGWNPVNYAPGLAEGSPTFMNGTYNNNWYTGYNFVSVLTDTQKWGHVALAGAVGDNTALTNDAVAAASQTNYDKLAGPNVHLLAWAIGPEIDILLPMIAPGDEFYANFAYSSGLLGEVSSNAPNDLTGISPIKRIAGGVLMEDSNLQVTSVNAAGVPLTIANNTGWEVGGYFTHYWTPQIRSNIGASYFKYNAATSLATNATTGLNTQVGSNSDLNVDGNIIWSPVKNFDLGVEVEWGEFRSAIQNPTAAFVAAGSPGLTENNWTFIFRAQRGF